MILKTYKKNRKIICYIQTNSNKFLVCTGKPSNYSCLSWQYETIHEAEKTANEYFNNYINIKIGA